MTTQDVPGCRSEFDALRKIRVELSRIIEPEDWIGMQLIHLLGPERASDVITDSALTERRIASVLAEHGVAPGHRGFSATAAAAVRRWKTRVAEPWRFSTLR